MRRKEALGLLDRTIGHILRERVAADSRGDFRYWLACVEAGGTLSRLHDKLSAAVERAERQDRFAGVSGPDGESLPPESRSGQGFPACRECGEPLAWTAKDGWAHQEPDRKRCSLEADRDRLQFVMEGEANAQASKG